MQVYRTCRYYNAPLVIAGDLFHKYNPSIELVNRVITWFQQFKSHDIEVFAIPGQHDLPHHRYEDMDKSAYGTLVKARVIKDIPPGVISAVRPKSRPSLALHGFPWGSPLTPIPKGPDRFGFVNVAVVHDYCWLGGHAHPGATEDKHAAKHANNLGGFDAGFFGDNHSQFVVQGARRPDGNKIPLINCGGFMRRDTTQLDHKPCMYLLDDTCKVHPIQLDISKDKVTTDHVTAASESESEVIPGAGEFLKSLDEMGQLLVDFKAATREYMEGKGTPPKVQDLVYRFIPTTEEKK